MQARIEAKNNANDVVAKHPKESHEANATPFSQIAPEPHQTSRTNNDITKRKNKAADKRRHVITIFSIKSIIFILNPFIFNFKHLDRLDS